MLSLVVLCSGCSPTPADVEPLIPDVMQLDAAPADSALPDSALPDATQPDGAQPDSARPDAGRPLPDVGQPHDATTPDLGPDAAPDMMPDAEINIDLLDPACVDPNWVPGPCVEGMGSHQEAEGRAAHVPVEQVIEYLDSPPSTGDHRSQWGRWGEYSYMPPQRWLHNLEHGGIAFLYHPCADPQLIDALRTYARNRPDDDVGTFRWVMTPYPDLPSAIAVMSWGWHYQTECFNQAEIDDFVDRFYRMAPEDVRSDGRYDTNWIGR